MKKKHLGHFWPLQINCAGTADTSEFSGLILGTPNLSDICYKATQRGSKVNDHYQYNSTIKSGQADEVLNTALGF